MNLFYPFYKHYFNVKLYGKENISDKQYMIVSNHSGQIAIDGMIISSAFFMELDRPRILRPMIEKFISGMPFVGKYTSECGAVLGDRKNCKWLIEHGQSTLVFPEGVKGISKDTGEFYKLKPFTKGFLQMALSEKIDIVPVAVVGAEEFYPYVYHLKKLKKYLNIPIMPLTPFFPILGPIGMIPMPSPVDVYIGKPYSVPKKLSPNAVDEKLNEHVFNIKNDINKMLQDGLKKRRESDFFNKLNIELKKSI